MIAGNVNKVKFNNTFSFTDKLYTFEITRKPETQYPRLKNLIIINSENLTTNNNLLVQNNKYILIFVKIVVRFASPTMVRTSVAIYKPFSMLARQDSLPPLPVPPLQQTMDKYLSAIKPLVDEEDFEYTQDLVKDFLKPKGDGEVLHNKLLQKAKTEKNWVGSCFKWCFSSA